MADSGNTKMRKVGRPKSRPRFVLDRPADKSLAEFKRWVGEMVGVLGGDEFDNLTEKEWRGIWKDFWSE